LPVCACGLQEPLGVRDQLLLERVQVELIDNDVSQPFQYLVEVA
jgi:hypothetical protein